MDEYNVSSGIKCNYNASFLKFVTKKNNISDLNIYILECFLEEFPKYANVSL